MNNTFDIIQLRKVMGLIIPDLFGIQKDILDNYIKNTMIDGLTDCMVNPTPVRRCGVSTVAMAIALAEGILGKSVLYVGENSYETNHLLRGIINLSGLPNVVKEANVRLATTDTNIKGSSFDIIIHETFVHYSKPPSATGVKAYRSLQSMHGQWILDTKCKVVYSIHA